MVESKRKIDISKFIGGSNIDLKELADPLDPARDLDRLMAVFESISEAKKPSVYVSMPALETLSTLRDRITSIVERFGGQVIFSAGSVSSEGSYKSTISDAIRSSSIVVGDISTQSPNVFYELGIAHALGKPTLIMVDRTATKRIPSDLSGSFYVTYDPADTADLETHLERSLSLLMREQ
jgi:hypothetical protein